MPDQLEGPALAAAVAMEVMGWEGNDLEGIWVPPGAAMVIECCPIDEWRPDSDPTTFFCDVVPAMRRRKPPCDWCFWGGVDGIGAWGQFITPELDGPISKHANANIATAGCLAALAAVRLTSLKAAKGVSEMDVLEFRAVVRSVLVGPFAREDALLLSFEYATAAPWRQLMCAAERE